MYGNRMPRTAVFKKNHILASLPEPEWKEWSPFLELVQMPLGLVLYEPGVKLTHIYFPITAIVSLLYVMENGASAEIAVVGNEGLVGISLFMGGDSTPSRAVVQSAGVGCRLKSDIMMNEFNKGGPTMHVLLRYTQALITQTSQTAVCNRHHSLAWRRARDDARTDCQHAGGSARGRHGRSAQAAKVRSDPVHAWQDHSSGSQGDRSPCLRVLRRGEERIRTFAAG
jgi:hypothetical protein